MIRALATLVLILGPASAIAQSGGHGHDRRPGGGLLNRDLARIAERLELTPEQQAQIRSIRAKYRSDTEADFEAAKAAHAELRALWTSGEVPTKDQVVAIQSRMRPHRMAMVDKAIDARIEVLKVLTKEQRKKLGEGHDERAKDGKGQGSGKGKGKRARKGGD